MKRTPDYKEQGTRDPRNPPIRGTTKDEAEKRPAGTREDPDHKRKLTDETNRLTT